MKQLRSRRMGSPTLSRSLEGYKIDETKQLLSHRRVLEDTRDWSGGTCEWNSAGAVASVLPGCTRTHESENHSKYAVVSMHVAAFLCGRWCATSPINERNRLRMREQEVVGLNQHWYHLEKWSWKKCADISSRALEANKHGCTRKINMRTPCEKNLCRDKERTTGAEDTQNQHYQRVHTVVDSFHKISFGFEVC